MTDSAQDLDEEGMDMGDFDANNVFKAVLGASALKPLVQGISFFNLADERKPSRIQEMQICSI